MIAAQLSAESAANPGRSGSVIKEIPSDGHCMYRAFADQVRVTHQGPTEHHCCSVLWCETPTLHTLSLPH